MVGSSPRQRLFFEAISKPDVAIQPDREGEPSTAAPSQSASCLAASDQPADLPDGRSGQSAWLSGASERRAEAAASVAEGSFREEDAPRNPPS